MGIVLESFIVWFSSVSFIRYGSPSNALSSEVNHLIMGEAFPDSFMTGLELECFLFLRRKKIHEEALIKQIKEF